MKPLKRLLSLVLSIVFCLSMTTLVLAADTVAPNIVLDKTVVYTGDGEQTVTMTLKNATAFDVSSASMDIVAKNENGDTLIAKNAKSDYLTDATLQNGKILAASSDSSNVNTDTVVKVEFTVDENTPAGIYTVGVENLELVYDGWSTYDIETTVTTILEIKDGKTPSIIEGYAATLTAATATVNQGDEVKVNVNVNKAFNSADIVLGYDASVLEFVSGALADGQTMTDKDQAAEIAGADGTITILDFGSAFVQGAAYTLTFTSLKGGVTNVTVESAGFSTAEEAETKDLITATGEGTSATINHKVSVNDVVTYVAPNGTYNGQISSYDPDNFTYEIAVKMGGVEQADPAIDNDGKFQITPVTGELVISYTATPKEYTVIWDDEENVVTNKNPDSEKVAYGTDITFEIPADKLAQGTEDGWSYKVTITYTGTEKVITPVISGQTYTIEGKNLTDDITIKVTKETLSATDTTITIEGSEKVQQNGVAVTSPLQVKKNTSVALTLIKQSGYTYTVTQYNGNSEEGSQLTVAEDGTFTVTVGTDPVRIVVTKTVVKTGLVVNETEYLALDNAKMWLVMMNEEKNDNKTYTITLSGKTEKFFWSDEYEAYCYLVITDKDVTFESVQEDLEVDGVIGIVEEAPVIISYDGNVNKTFNSTDEAVIDVNDAQLVWNMYNAYYPGFTNISVEKFLCADVEGDGDVDTHDAAAIVTIIKTQN